MINSKFCGIAADLEFVGQYLEWQEVCGKYDKAVFEDGMGRLGEEEGLGQPLYNKFGKLISSEVNGTHV